MRLPVSTKDGLWCAFGTGVVRDQLFCTSSHEPASFRQLDLGPYELVALTELDGAVVAAGKRSNRVELVSVTSDGKMERLGVSPADSVFEAQSFNGAGGRLAVAGRGVVYVFDRARGFVASRVDGR